MLESFRKFSVKKTTTDRKFAAFSKVTQGGQDSVPPFRMKEIPDGGFCLSAFLVISDSSEGSVLMGRMNPAADWDHLGALDESRVLAHSKSWMLPSSHLIIRESPQQAAKRILKEQLGIDERSITLSEPKVVSEVYTPKRFPNLSYHWDIEFIFRGTLADKPIPKSDAWTDLRFMTVGNMARSEIARSHEDILESAGFKFLSD